MWVGLNEVAARENCSIHDICTLISYRKNENTSLTAAIRVFVMLYYRAAATEDGHQKVGHGNFEIMKKRARIPEEYQSHFSYPAKRSRRRREHEALENIERYD